MKSSELLRDYSKPKKYYTLKTVALSLSNNGTDSNSARGMAVHHGSCVVVCSNMSCFGPSPVQEPYQVFLSIQFLES
jgi:hypothetical protein